MNTQNEQAPSYWDAIRCHWKKILLGTAIGFLLGVGGYAYFPSEWEAEALIQIGKVGQVEGLGGVDQQAVQLGQVGQIETATNVIERIKSPAFIEAVAKRVGRPELKKLLDGHLGGKGAIKVQQIRNTNLLKVSVWAGSADLAKLAVESVVDELAAKHVEMASPAINYLKFRLANLNSAIEADEKVAKDILNRMDFLRKGGAHTEEYSLLLASQATQENTLAEKTKLAMRIQMALSDIYTRPTGVIEPVSVSSAPVFPRLKQFVLLGGLAGLFVSLILILRRYA